MAKKKKGIKISAFTIESSFHNDETPFKDLRIATTGRGFQFAEFKDRYGQECSLQASSLATEGAIWFGVDNTGPELKGPSGKFNEAVSARMHLTRAQVAELLPALIGFVKTGYLELS